MNSTVKRIARTLAIVTVTPIYIFYVITRCMTSANESLETYSQWISLIPGKVGNLLRNAFYRMTLEHCDPTATICFGALISKTSARLGKNVYVGPRCMLGWVTLESDVLLGPAVQILSGGHIHGAESLDAPIRNQPGKLRRVTIGADSWIGAACVVLTDVGSQTIVGANSTVTKPIANRTIAVGSPARKIASRNQELEKAELIEQ